MNSFFDSDMDRGALLLVVVFAALAKSDGAVLVTDNIACQPSALRVRIVFISIHFTPLEISYSCKNHNPVFGMFLLVWGLFPKQNYHENVSL